MPDEITRQTVLSCLAEHYGLKGALQRLAGENLNYRLDTPEGRRYVVKIVDEDMPSEVVEMEFLAIKHAVSAGYGPRLPEIIPNLHQNIETGITLHANNEMRLRILSFVVGDVLENMPDISIGLLKNVGTSLADFNQVMKNFHHPAAVRDHRWNLVHAGRHRGGLKGVEPVEKRLMLQQAFAEFSAVETGLNRLPFQFIHGDANRENILVEGERVSGLVDFGDCLENPVVCELAIGLVYLMMDSDRPLENAAAVVRGYHERRPLDDGELAMLYPLACARLAVSLSIAARRRAIDPGHPNWFSSEASAWRLLAFLQKAGPGTFRNQVLP